MTYGTLKFRLTQAFPSLSLDLIEGWIQDRYNEILGELPWSRLDFQANLQTVAPYVTGTVAVVLGSNAVTGTGTTWIAGMTARAFRVVGQSEFYRFTYLSATTATLDRVYEGTSNALAGYSIFQNVYVLPSDCRLLANNAFSGSLGPMDRFTHAQLNLSDPNRTATGTPQAWASYMDDNSTPPLMRVELFPYPDAAIGIPFTYSAEPADLAAVATIFQVWMQPAALVEGTTGKIKAFLKDYTGAAYHDAKAAAALKNMRSSEAQGSAPAMLTLDPYFTRYRMHRGGL